MAKFGSIIARIYWQGWLKNLPKEVAMKVAFQGEPGAYSEEASMGYLLLQKLFPVRHLRKYLQALAREM